MDRMQKASGTPVHLERTRLLVVILVIIATSVFAITSFLSYQTSVSQMRDSLAEIAYSRAQLIRAVLNFDAIQASDFSNDSLSVALSKFSAAQRWAPGFGETGEFVLARRNGEVIEFLVDQRFQTGSEPAPIEWRSQYAEPMREALNGNNGSMIGLDYRGVRVLAAYAPVEHHNLGVVIKIDLQEITRPFIEQGLMVALVIVGLVGVGAYGFSTITNPVIKRLVVSETRLEEAQRISNMGNWEWDIPTGRIHWSDQIFRIFGEEPGSFDPTYERFFHAIHPEDRAIVEESVNASLADPSQEYMVSHRIILPDGQVRIVREQGEVIRDRHGEPIRIAGVVVDITRFKFVQQSLTLLEQAIQNIDESLVILDLKGGILDCNRAYLESSGYSRSEVIGKLLSPEELDVNSKHNREKVLESLWSNGEWRGELWDRRKNGEVYPIEAFFTTIKDERDKPTHIVVSFRDISKEYEQKNQLENLAYFDQLTGLPNRTKITQQLQQSIENKNGDNAEIGVCLLDLDEFKTLNTSLGHDMGDELLKQVASRLRDCKQAEDDLARFGGDEFLLIVNKVDKQRSVQMVLDQVFGELGTPYLIGSTELQMGISAGVSIYPRDGDNAVSLIANAELALEDYRSKELRGFQFFTESMQANAKKRRAIESQIRDGLGKEEFLLHYQPKLDLKTNQIVGMESLVRWRRENGELVSPSEFIPIAESTGLIVPMGEKILSSAVHFCADINNRLNRKIQVAVNLSPRQFIQKDLVSVIAHNIKQSGISPEQLELEVTESAAMIGVDHMVDTLSQLRDLGCTIAIDDFGTGYSSLSYLKRFPVDVLKIDRAFVRGVTEREDDAEMARAILAMAKSLKLKTVAEGVETSEQLEFFRGEGCDVIQGYLFSKPLPENEVTDFISNSLHPKAIA